jgi:hypothetical protein
MRSVNSEPVGGVIEPRKAALSDGTYRTNKRLFLGIGKEAGGWE